MDMNRRAWFAQVATSVASCSAMFGCGASEQTQQVEELDACLSETRGKPLTLFWNNVKLHDVSTHKRRWAAIQRFLSLPFPDSRYHRLHWLRFVGPFLRLASTSTSESAFSGNEVRRWRELLEQFLSELLNSDAYGAAYHESLHVRTPHGVGFITAEQQGARESRFADPHPNKILSLFALSGLGLNHQLMIDGERFTVADCVRSASRHCDLRAELPWTTVALCHYLPPTKGWRDKSDAQLDFDRIGIRLCETALGEGACFGHHILFSLVAVLRAWRQHNQLIQPRTVDRIRYTLKRGCDLLKTTQLNDGSWPANWTGNNPVKDGDSFNARFISTSHVLEWLSYAARDTAEMTVLCEAAAEWLCQTLLDLNEYELGRNYNSAAHAAFGLMCLFDVE